MKILRSHFLKEFFTTFLLCLAGFLLVFLAGRGFIQMADLIFNKHVDALLIFKLVFLSAPFILIFIIPISILVASLLTFGRLSHDNEITAMKASGISMGRVLAPFLVSVFGICLASLILCDQVASVTHYMHRKILSQIGLGSPAAFLEEGTFIKKFKNFVIFIYEIDKNMLKGIRIYQPQEGKPTRTIVAQKGELLYLPDKELIKLKLMHGTSDEPDTNNPSKLYKLNFKTYELPLSTSGVGESEPLGKKPKDMTLKELRNEIQRLGEEGIRATYPLSAEIHNKFALSFSSLAFLLTGIGLGIAGRRHEKALSFVMSLAVLVVYWILLIGGKALAQKGLLPAFASLQFSNFIVGGFGALLLLRMARR